LSLCFASDVPNAQCAVSLTKESGPRGASFIGGCLCSEFSHKNSEPQIEFFDCEVFHRGFRRRRAFRNLTHTGMDIRLISNIRVILALSTLAVTYLDPSEPQRHVALTYCILIFYSFYAALLYLVSLRRANFIPVRFTHWIDVVWYLILITFSSGTNSIFFFLFFFPIQTASFRFGFAEGFRVTVVSALLFIVFGYLAAPAESFELNRFLLRVVYLSVMGYMIAFWGGKEFSSKRRLAILKDINRLYNPRFGVDQTINAILQRINEFFDADSCLLISADPFSSNYILRQTFRGEPAHSVSATSVGGENPLLKLPGEKTIIYYDLERKPFGRAANFLVYDSATGERIKAASRRDGEVLADLLETKSFISVPLYRRESFAGRLYLNSQKKIFSHSDLEFLSHLLEHAVPVVENVNLLDRLASEATEQQRLKISRDIHDSTVQPYIGIKLGLESLQIKLAAGEDIAGDISQLVGMANANIAGIRSYINRLKDGDGRTDKGVVLVSAIRQQAVKIGEFYGIQIEVAAASDISVSDRLAAEVFQIVTEGLSNIKRHTRANRAVVSIKCDDKRLNLEIENNVPDGARAADFVPKSIAGRARALGGRAFVEKGDGRTKVAVEIPL
jgi:signal transduction histidine kinase